MSVIYHLGRGVRGREGGFVLREVKGLYRLWRKGQKRAKKAEGRAQCHGVQPLEHPGLSACFLVVVVGERGWGRGREGDGGREGLFFLSVAVFERGEDKNISIRSFC